MFENSEKQLSDMHSLFDKCKNALIEREEEVKKLEKILTETKRGLDLEGRCVIFMFCLFILSF
jgi:hypothetical protein